MFETMLSWFRREKPTHGGGRPRLCPPALEALEGRFLLDGSPFFQTALVEPSPSECFPSTVELLRECGEGCVLGADIGREYGSEISGGTPMGQVVGGMLGCFAGCMGSISAYDAARHADGCPSPDYGGEGVDMTHQPGWGA